MGPTAIGFWRLIIGSGILFVWTRMAGHSILIPFAILKYAIPAGFLFFADLYLWHRSIIYCGAGMSTILANTQVFVTAALGYFLFRERLNVLFMLAATIAVVGVAMLVGIGSDFAFTPRYTKGIFFGLATALMYASYIVTLKKAGESKQCPHILTLMSWVSLFSACFSGMVALTEPEVFLPPDLNSVLILVGLGLIPQAVGWWAIATSLPRLQASLSGLIILLQPVLTVVWGGFMFGEYLSLWQIAGAVITLAAIYLGSIRRQSTAQ